MRPRRRMNWQRLALVTAGAALVLAPAFVVLMRENNLAPSPSAAPAPSPAAQTPPTVTSASNFFAGRNSYDDSGYVAVTYMVLQLERQSFSLAHDRYYHAGYRGAQAVEKYLAGRSLTEREQFDSLQERLRFYLYEGDFAKAAPLLETMREMVDSDSSG